MKYLDEYRNGEIAQGIVAELTRRATRPWVLMRGADPHAEALRHRRDAARQY